MNAVAAGGDLEESDTAALLSALSDPEAQQALADYVKRFVRD